MKKSLKIFAALIFVIMFIVSNKSFASTSNEDYTIESYDIDMIVNEDNTFEITENIIANFNVAKHGIYRKIPLVNYTVRNDGTLSINNAKISNLSVSENYTTYNEFSYYKVIQIGSSNQTYTGRRAYTIKYTYDIGKDPLENADELYFNLVGDGWDTSIRNVSFKITMPKPFDKSLLGFSSGEKGSTNSSNVSYKVIENVISGNLKNKLDAGQALTIRLTLPEGYFVEKLSVKTYSAAVITFSIICVLIAFGFWVNYGRDDEVVETVEFYPPEGYNSAEVGFLYDGIANDKSVISLLIYLANKGYLKIEGKSSSKKNESFKITKIKEYDGDNEYEKLFFNDLFENSESTDCKTSKSYVTESDLYNNFYITLDKIKSKLNSKKNKGKIFESSASGKCKWLIMMAIAIYSLITVKPLSGYDGDTIFFAFIFPGMCFSLMLCMFFFGKNLGPMYVNGKPTNSVALRVFLGLMCGPFFGGITWYLLAFPALNQSSLYMIMYIIGIICITVLAFFIRIMPKRTHYGNEMLGKLRGFKRFLETAEKEQLETLVEKNPEYFYDILPYTYALDVSNIWISQFENIAMQAPNWYDSTDNFDIHTFSSFMTTSMSDVSTAMSSSPSSDGGSSSGSSSSGGGSSGGGSGGGGGGSW